MMNELKGARRGKFGGLVFARTNESPVVTSEEDEQFLKSEEGRKKISADPYLDLKQREP